jgi:hypothetical protein
VGNIHIALSLPGVQLAVKLLVLIFGDLEMTHVRPLEPLRRPSKFPCYSRPLLERTFVDTPNFSMDNQAIQSSDHSTYSTEQLVRSVALI